MKLSYVLALATAVNAQYLSSGWTPGQAVTAEGAAPSFVGVPRQAAEPAQPASLSSLFDMKRILSSESVKGLLAKAGINITEQLEVAAAAAAVSPWDTRIPLITDDNYVDMVVNETMTEEEERQRVWVIIVSALSTRQEGISKFLDGVFDDAYNETMIAADLPHVRWARIDYLNVTYVTTRWNLWVSPSFVILQDRGQTLRFYRPNQLRIVDGALREFLKQQAYLATPPWSGAFAPGGSRGFVLEYFAKFMTWQYLISIRIPRWILFIVTGAAASFLVNILHGFGPKKKSEPAPRAVTRPAAGAATPATTDEAAAAPAAPLPASPSGAKQRKGKGKK
ncbi:hypothetical protein GGX14DRAFT_645322 [Mycena pura]|uniref:Thioredoxin-like fold domain-containing protein n=1 Tax=Mycena pura TaxID=153505 RepID=A0AAD6VBS5_9AGAR|nr:hypothetical protein GGX14DRAFT_645322 [Mycena pura]